jgi:hypothetical protein
VKSREPKEHYLYSFVFRRFDKTIQFIVGSKGQIGMTYEHSPAEGPPIANLTDHVMDVV